MTEILLTLAIAQNSSLHADDCLADMAQKRAVQIETTGAFSHAYNGRQPFVEMIRECGRYRRAGENLSYGYETAQEIHAAWMASPTHRENITGQYDRIGIACSGLYCVQFFSKSL
jgi:uncharacterized protein YkwD